VVREDHSGERGSLEVVSPRFKGTDYGHEFLVIYFIVLLCRVEGVRYISTGVVVSVHVFLSYDCPVVNLKASDSMTNSFVELGIRSTGAFWNSSFNFSNAS